jgi:hypothetical protein
MKEYQERFRRVVGPAGTPRHKECKHLGWTETAENPDIPRYLSQDFVSRNRPPFIPSPPIADIIEDDFGRYRLGINDDATPGFESRRFAESVRLKQTRHSDRWLRQ